MSAKKTPFYELGLESGAQMIELFGYYLPWAYSPGHIEEHQATRNRVSICDLHYMAEFIVDGPDAKEYIQKVSASDFSSKKVKSVKYTAFCNSDGKMEDDGTVWRVSEDRYLIITGDESDWSWFEENKSNYKVELYNVTDEHTTLAVQGPNSYEVIKKLANKNIDDIRYYTFVEDKIAGVDCKLARMGYTGEFGYELHFNSQYASNIWNALLEAGKEYNIVPLGQAALESLRQEAGYLLVGNDHDKETNPYEAGLGFVVHLNKDDFNGKDALTNVLLNGVSRTLVWFRLPEGHVPNKGDPIFSYSKKIGAVTSGSYSPTFQQGVALGYVDTGYAINGAKYQIKSSDKEGKASLSVTPLYDPGNIKSSNRKL